MDFAKKQVGKLLQQVKLAMLSHTPIIYIPTPNIEVIKELLYSPECTNAIIPRTRERNGRTEILESGQFFEKKKDKDNNEVEVSIIDNYKSNIPKKNFARPTLACIYCDKIAEKTSDLYSFVRLYLDIKSNSNSENYNRPEDVRFARQSVCLVVTPSLQEVPEQLRPYVRIVTVEPLEDEEIEEIIYSQLLEHQIGLDVFREKMDLLTQMKESFRGLSSLRIKNIMSQIILSQSIDFDGIVEREVLKTIHNAKKEVLAGQLGLKWEAISDDEVAGLDNVTDWIDKHAPLFKDPEQARKNRLEIPSGILMVGIPGSGKSLMAHVTARRMKMPLISLNMGMLRGGIVGESEHNMKDALRIAEDMAPCVLWIDEIEKAMSGSNSDGGDSGVGQRMFGTFLTWMQEKSSACFVFATSNDISQLPPELFRSGRFDKKFFTYMPRLEECAAIFGGIIRKQNEKYEEYLDGLEKSIRRTMSQKLFDDMIAEPKFWLDVLNETCNQTKAVQGEEKEYHRPTNKLLSGADIAAIVKEAKFEAYQQLTSSEKESMNGGAQPRDCVYEEMSFKAVVEKVIIDSNPYGETNLKDLAKSFHVLYQNQFTPASKNPILNFNKYDDDKLEYSHEERDDQEEYDKTLYDTIVGAINHYLPKIYGEARQ